MKRGATTEPYCALLAPPETVPFVEGETAMTYRQRVLKRTTIHGRQTYWSKATGPSEPEFLRNTADAYEPRVRKGSWIRIGTELTWTTSKPPQHKASPSADAHSYTDTNHPSP